MAKTKQGADRRGYTFTLSVILIAATIIAAAEFAREWSRIRDSVPVASLAGAVLASEQARMAGDLAAILGAGARLQKNSTHTSIMIAGSFPLKKEGLIVADVQSYARKLPGLLRNHLQMEAVLSADAVADNATVLLLPWGGAVSYDNNMSYGNDQMQYVHPVGSAPAVISLSIYCGKNQSRNISGPLIAGGGIGTVNYSIAYSDMAGSSYGSVVAVQTSDVIYSVSFSDGSNLSMVSNLSSAGGGANQIKLSYTKSPGAYVVLPFDGNVSSGTGAVIDYSPFGNNFTLGGGKTANSPQWVTQCHSGGCYHFNGSSQFINSPHLNFTGSALNFSNGPELLLDGGLESYKGTAGDGVTDDWRPNWTVSTSGAVFDATVWPQNVHSGSSAVNISGGTRPGASDMIYQEVPGLSPATKYALSFWTKGDGTHSAKYSVMDNVGGTSYYLQSDGTWTPTVTILDSGVTGTTYAQVSTAFQLASGSGGTIQIQFLQAVKNSIYYLDDVSLKNASGLNGGFEDYATGSPTQDIFGNWAIQGGDATFKADGTNAHTGAVGLHLMTGGDTGAYIYTTSLALNNSTEYALEFWTKGGDGGGSIRYGIYDVANDRYLEPDGSWGAQGGGSIIIDSGITNSVYTKVVKNFRTLPSGVGPVELHFYVPANPGANAYLDDVAISEVKDFTISMWLQTYGTNPGSPSLLYQYDAANSQGFNWSVSGNNITMNLFSNGSSRAPSVAMPDGDWHMLTFVANRTGNYTVYFDGALNSTANFSIGALNNTAQFVLGSDGGGSSASFNGSMDEFRIYRRALTSAEVQNMYRGRYQDSCKFNLTVSYSDASLLSQQLEIDYNAHLRLRSVPPDELLAMPFDLNTVSTAKGAVTDYSPLAAGGTIGNTTLSWLPSCAVGGCYSFKNGGYIQAPAVPDFGTGNFTVSFWVSGVPSGADQALLSKGSWLPGNGWMVYSAAAGPVTGWDWWNGAAGLSMGATSGSWTHYAIVRNGTGSGDLAIYVNGAYSSSGTDSGNYNSGMPLTIGETSDADTAHALNLVSVDELRMFNRSLSAAEVRSLYMDYSKVYDGPVVASRD